MPPHADSLYERRWWTLAVLCLSLLMIIVGNTVLNVAIPTLIRDIGATNSQLQWIVDAYSLVFAGLLLTSGALGDRYGRKGALNIGLLVFGAGSLAAALSDTPSQLIAYGIIEAPIRGWGDSLILGAFGLGLAVFVVFAVWELRATHPMLDLRAFRRPALTGGSLAISLVFFAMFGTFFMLTQYFQIVH